MSPGSCARQGKGTPGGKSFRCRSPLARPRTPQTPGDGSSQDPFGTGPPSTWVQASVGGKPQGGGLVPLGPCWGFPESRWGNPCVLPLAERCRRGTEAKSVGKGGMTKVSVVEEMATGTYSGACAVRCGRPQRCIASGRRRRRRRRGGRRWARGCPPCPSGLVRRGPHSPCR